MRYCILLCLALTTNFLNSQDISGHWHLHKMSPANDSINDNTFITLDVFQNQFAFFNISELKSPDKSLYESFIADSSKSNNGFKLTNVDSKKKLIKPFSWGIAPAVHELKYKIIDNKTLKFYDNENRKSKSLFIAKKSRSCEKDDYCYFNTNEENSWCEMTYDLPNCDFDSVEFKGDAKFSFDIYMGFVPYERSYDKKKLIINFNGGEDITFGELEYKISRFRKTIPGRMRPRIIANLHIDKDVPFICIVYLKAYLIKSNKLRINYVNDSNKRLLTKLPFGYYFSKCCLFHECEPKITRNVFTPSHIREMGKNFNLNPILFWNPEVNCCYIDSVINKNFILNIKLYSNGKIEVNSTRIEDEDLMDICYQFLSNGDNAKRQIILTETAPTALFKDYLYVLTLISA